MYPACNFSLLSNTKQLLDTTTGLFIRLWRNFDNSSFPSPILQLLRCPRINWARTSIEIRIDILADSNWMHLKSIYGL